MAVVATGFFDGVHLGHQHVIDMLVSTARNRGETSIVVTFWPHPRTVLQDGARELRLLTSLSEKKELLTSMGVDNVEVLDFSREFSHLTAYEYIRDVVIGRFGGGVLVVGYDNRIGCDQCGPGDIEEIASTLGVEIVTVGRFISGDEKISSTNIRRVLSDGDVEQAAAMLGRRYSLSGVVVAGNRLGRTLGYPTANMQLYEPLKLIPGNGVYAVEVSTVGRHLYGMCNIGVRPTVAGTYSTQRSIETNIFDFDEEIYGLDIELRFIKKIRDERLFSSLNDLKSQLAQDKEFILRSCPIPF